MALAKVLTHRVLGLALVRPAVIGAIRKLNPREQVRNPVMFTVYLGSILTTCLGVAGILGHGETGASTPGTLAIALWLWITVLFANFAEAMAEGRGKARAAALRSARRDLPAKRLTELRRDAPCVVFPSSQLKKGDWVLVEAGDDIPCDGEVVEGAASVNEAAVTGESAPVIRESGGDRSSVTGGTHVLSDWLIVKVTSNPGETFLDRMIGMVEGARRQKTPNEIALDILLAGFTIIFLLVCMTLLPFSSYAAASKEGTTAAPVTISIIVALLVCLIPTTIGGLLSAVRIAGMDRMVRANVISTSGRAVEAAGDVDVLLLDKTGTITMGNRQATAFLPAPGVTIEQLADAAQLSSLADETPEGRSVVILAKQQFNMRERDLHALGARFVAFSAQTRMSGVDCDGREIRKGSVDAIDSYVRRLGGTLPEAARLEAQRVAARGSTPLLVAASRGPIGQLGFVYGVIELKDIVKGGIAERFAELRRMGIRTVMITGDNPTTAAAIAAEAGVDDFLAQATPEKKLELIREHQRGGRLVAMTGDGTNDAPALAQADVAVTMNTGTQAAKEAGNMIDLDSNPAKLIEIVRVGKQLLMTRGALTTFSLANDLAKYFAIIPAAFADIYPQLGALNIMKLHPETAVLSSVIFNAIIIIALVPLAMKGVSYRAVEASSLLRTNLLIYGIGGILVPFPGIKIIDMLLQMLPITWS